MEVLIFILIIVFVFANKNKGKNAKNAPKRAPRPQRTAMEQFEDALDKLERPIPTQEAPAPRKVASVKVATQKSPVFMATPRAAKPAPAVEVKAPSLLDEEGCVGGSMAHTHEEGESREEHRRHIESARQREAEESRAAQAALELSEMNLQRLRQAVVMAEILDRPKALRRAR